MYKASLVSIFFIFHTKFIHCTILGEDTADETTPTPMDLSKLTHNDWCKFQPNSYDCGERGRTSYRYYYDIKLGDCRTAVVGDCDENLNAYYDMEHCRESCFDAGQHPVTLNLTPNVFCRMQPDFGMCESYFPLWYFDVSTKTCKGYSYSGCGGNANKFRSVNDCTESCVHAIEYKVQS